MALSYAASARVLTYLSRYELHVRFLSWSRGLEPAAQAAGHAPHAGMRPSGDGQACGKPWPCDAARVQLSADYSRTHLALYMGIEMVYAARDNLEIPPEVLYRRYLGWTRSGSAVP